MAKKGKKNPPKKKANGYKMPPPIPPGEIIRHGDKEWKIGPSIGVGGFGEIYTACEYKKNESPPDVTDYPFVVKIEPEENGPLFVEMHFYNRNYHEDDIQEFMQSRNLSMLGMPRYIGSGTVNIKGEDLRFLIVERYSTDLWKIFNQVGKRFPAPTVFQLGLQMIDVLDYIHSRSYIHADIKGSNILLGIKEGTENQAYLLDFGLAYRIVDDNYKPDAKSSHEGTIEYTSTDRHIGAKTMRGDLEILGFNLFHWLVGTLPWEGVLDKPQAVHKMKSDFVNNVRARITTDYPDVPDALIKFFEYIRTLEPKDQPDYSVCRHIFERYLTSVGKTRSSQLKFNTTDENDSQSEVDEKEKQIIPNNKNKVEKHRLAEKVSISEINTVIDYNKEDIDENKETSATVDKNPEVISLTESYSINELVDSKQKRKVLKYKKTKEKNSNEIRDITENVLEIEKLDESHEKKSKKSKKNKDKRGKNLQVSSLVKNDDKNEEPSGNQEEKPGKNKKNKKQRGNRLQVISSAENDTEIDQLDKNHEHKVSTVTKIIKLSAYSPRTYNYDKSEQIYDYQEDNVATDDIMPFSVSKNKNDKKKTKKKQRDASPAENDNEPEQPGDNQGDKVTEVRKNKKQKVKKLKNPPAANNSEIEQNNDNQDKEFTKNKKRIRKRYRILKDTSLAKNDDDSDDEQTLMEIGNNKKKRLTKKKAKDTSAEGNENEQIENDQKQEVTRSKRSKRKCDKKTEAVNEIDSEFSDDYKQPTKKKRKSSKTPSKKKNEAKAYPDDSEGEPQDKTRNKKRVKVKLDEVSKFWPKLPVKQVDPDTAFPERELRCKYRKTRPNYTGT